MTRANNEALHAHGRRRYSFPWRQGNRFQLLVDAQSFLPRMLGAIAEARHYVFLEMYLFESGVMASGFIDALARASARGVKMYVLLDDFGARALNPADRQRLTGVSAEVRFFNPVRYGKWYQNLHRDHRKLLLVDGRVAVCGGAGVTDSFMSRSEGGQDWHDVMVHVEGPCVADWHTLFAQTWQLESGQPIDLPAPATTQQETAVQLGRVTEMTPRDGKGEILRSALKRIGSAEQRVWIATAYFVPSLKLRRALRRAARRGVDVRLLLPSAVSDHPGVHQAGRHFYSRLLRNKVGIYEYQGRFAHAKMILCDSWCSIGSSNLDRWNVRWNLEANQEVDDSGFAAQVADLFEQDFSGSQQFEYEWWRQRPWHWRWREWFWSRIGRWLLQLGLGR